MESFVAKKPQMKLSPSSLNLFFECPRCFWLRFTKKVKRPEGPSSTLPRGMDHTLKNHFDNHRKHGLLPELLGKVPGRLLSDAAKMKSMRNTSFGFQLNDEVWFGGGLDDALELPDSSVVPLDNKTKGFPPKETHWTQLKQMSGYTLILREKGIATKNVAYLVHWHLDHKHMQPDNPFAFNVKVEEVPTDPDEIKKSILEAVEILKGPMPPMGTRSGADSDEPCAFCTYRESAP